MKEQAEQDLWRAFQTLVPEITKLRLNRHYRAAIEAIATLRPHVDRFFDETMVLVEDAELRGNRLALLAVVVDELSRVADCSELVAGAQEVPA